MERQKSSTWFGFVGVCVAVAASAVTCAQNNDNVGSASGSVSGSNGGAGGSAGAGSSGSGGDGGITLATSSSGSGGTACDIGLPDQDNDGDGFTELELDCNDCDEFVNPNAIEVIAEPDGMGNTPDPADEDCDGKIDVMPASCDTGLALNSTDPMDAVKAMGMCKFVKSAKWARSDGDPPPTDPTQLANFHLGHGILSKFGTNNSPQEGSSMLMLSSGTARNKLDPESVSRTFDKGYTSNHPYGFPKPSPSCLNVVTGQPHDATGVQLEVIVPSNALSVSFDFQFFTYEWGDFICKAYNDFFVAHVEPFPIGQTDGNIAFDGLNNAISVNSAFIGACGCPGNPPGECLASGFWFKCALGKGPLVGTPFEKDEANPPGWTHGSTGWLRTTTPVTPGGSFNIRFVTYDSDDGNVDSSTLIDNWRWSGKPGTTYTEPIDPK